MRRFWTFFPLLALSLAGCQIEQTPPELIDVLQIPEDEISASREELTDRLLSTGPALQRRAIGDLLAALTPAGEITGFGPTEPVTDPTSLGYALTTFADGNTVRMDDVVVEVGPRNNVAWFRSVYSIELDDGATDQLRFSGVFLRDAGNWRLVEAHISQPVSRDSLPQ